MAFGGLSSQFMMKAESTIGTAVTVDTAYEILPATDSALDLTVLEGVGVQSGVLAQRDSRVTTSTFSASGVVEMEVPDQGHFGLLLKHAMGSSITVPVVIATTAFKQIHTIGSKDALGLTMQYGMPRLTDGVGVALTYNGCKI